MMPKKKKLVAIALGIFTVAFVCVTYLDAYLAGVVKTRAEREVLAKSGFELDLGVVEVNALRGDVVALGPRMRDPERKQTLALAQRVTVDASPLSPFRDIITINSVAIWKLDTLISVDAQGIPQLPKRPIQAPSLGERPGLRIDQVDVYVEEFVVEHTLPQGNTIKWRIHTGDLDAEKIRLPFVLGSEIPASLSATLLEPSTGTIVARYTFTPLEDGWRISGQKEAMIAQVAALNPYLPPDFPLAAKSGGLTVRSQLLLHGTVLESTTTIALTKPRFEPRERNIGALFKGQMSQFAVRAIRDSTGDIRLDPIYVSGDLSDPELDLRRQFAGNLRKQILDKIFGSAKSIPSDIAKKLQSTIRSLPADTVLSGVGKVADKALEAGVGLAEKGKQVGETAAGAAKGVGSRIKSLIKRDE